jgi:glycosyltransferase involved in cell wall biosynthesis
MWVICGETVDEFFNSMYHEYCMKICIINNLYPPYTRGGAEQVVVKTVEGLVSAGHSVVVITTAPNGVTIEENGSIKIYRYLPANLFFYTEANRHGVLSRLIWHAIDMFHLPSMYFVRRILQIEKPDVVHTHNLMGMSFLVPRMIRRLGIRHVHTVHDVQLVEPSGIIQKSKENSWRYQGFPVRIYSWIMRFLVGSPNVVISPSQFLLNFYESRGFFKNSKRVVLRNPVTSEVQSIKKENHDTLHFLYLGQVEGHKGVLFLVKTFLHFLANLSDAINRPILHIAGSGSELDHVKQLTNNNQQFVIHGKLDRTNLPSLFAMSDVTIVPSLCYENSPTVIFESFSFGVPVLASNVEGIAELIQEGENGLTFTTENEESLLQKLKWCFEHQKELTQMSLKTHLSLVGLSVGEYVGKLLSLYF